MDPNTKVDEEGFIQVSVVSDDEDLD